MNVARGIAYIITNGSTIPFNNQNFSSIFNGSILGIPIPMIIVLILLAITSFILHKTKIGREIYAIGSNELAAKYAGINQNKYCLFVYFYNSRYFNWDWISISNRESVIRYSIIWHRIRA